MFLTALKGAENEKARYDAGADDYITKPFRIGHLVENLQIALAANSTDEHKQQLLKEERI